jgi:ATP-dependent DNA helicase RecG
VRSAKAEFARLKDEIFPDLRLGLLHGRLKSQEKEAVLQGFRDKQYDILVTTPVVEVGIDIPNATVMMIEGAERFGLAQLHQLRGRVGRGSTESWCLLFTEDRTEKTRARLQALEKSSRGQELAELDLALRGPGEIYGLRQSGIPDLKVASLTDLKLLEETKTAAAQYLQKNSKLPAELKLKLKPMLAPAVTPD